MPQQRKAPLPVVWQSVLQQLSCSGQDLLQLIGKFIEKRFITTDG